MVRAPLLLFLVAENLVLVIIVLVIISSILWRASTDLMNIFSYLMAENIVLVVISSHS
jgi:hypothetical protein